MRESISFNVRLYRSGQITIPRWVVNGFQLYKGDRVRVQFYNRTMARYVRFISQIGAHFRISIPRLELYGSEMSPGMVFQIDVTKLDGNEQSSSKQTLKK